MRIHIEHEIQGRIRFASGYGAMTDEQADMLLYYLLSLQGVEKAKVYQRSGNAVVCFSCGREALVEEISLFTIDDESVKKLVPEHTSRALNNEYKHKLVNCILKRIVTGYLLPAPFRQIWTSIRFLRYLKDGILCLAHRKLEVPVLDATALGVSIFRGDFKTAGSVMFMLTIGELMEEWTHKKSVADLAGSMALNVDKVWICNGDDKRQIPLSNVQIGDLIHITVGTMIPLDGVVEQGEATVNQASLTGESLPVKKGKSASVYAGTVLEEGELYIRVTQIAGNTRYEKIINMIEASEKLKAMVESKAEHLADRLVPYSFLATLLTWLLTKNPQKAATILMVDFSCALKLSMPVTVLSAMRECNQHQIVVKGGKFLEAVAQADTLVFDKTGTLTQAKPSVESVIPFNGHKRDDMLRIAACLEEHFPHSIASAVVHQAEKEGLDHKEMHAKVNYIIAHGIASEIEGKRVCIGSHHFIFEDEKCAEPVLEHDKFHGLSEDGSLLYMSIAGELAAVLCIKDPLREEAPAVIAKLKEMGIGKIVMMTGDSEHTAKAIARQVGVDKYFAEVLPEEKAGYVLMEKEQGRTVIMIGDGINDSPALSAADVGIAISEGAHVAREISDITISQDNLYELVVLKELSDQLVNRISSNYRVVIGFNSALLLMGLAGLITPQMSAFLHNMSTLGIGMHSMTNLLPEDIDKDF